MLVYFMTIWNIFKAMWYNLWPFDIICEDLVYISRFGMFGPRKIWQPCIQRGADFYGFESRTSRATTASQNKSILL
jgi:hypothetical protein